MTDLSPFWQVCDGAALPDTMFTVDHACRACWRLYGAFSAFSAEGSRTSVVLWPAPPLPS